jgi:hypothetical protein
MGHWEGYMWALSASVRLVAMPHVRIVVFIVGLEFAIIPAIRMEKEIWRAPAQRRALVDVLER